MARELCTCGPVCALELCTCGPVCALDLLQQATLLPKGVRHIGSGQASSKHTLIPALVELITDCRED